MATAEGYTYVDVTASPVALDELVRAVGLDDADRNSLRRLWELIAPRLDASFEAWMSRIAWFFAPTSAGADGRPIEAYMEAAHPRVLRWSEDTCTRPYDEAWLDYQHEDW